MNPHERQSWLAAECVVPPPETTAERGAVIVQSTHAERRSIVAILLAMRRDIPTVAALDLLMAAPLDLDGTAGTAWVGAVAYTSQMECLQ